MADTYTLHIAGLTRELPICKVNDHMDIAAFIMFSDVELTEACAAALLKKASHTKNAAAGTQTSGGRMAAASSAPAKPRPNQPSFRFIA